MSLEAQVFRNDDPGYLGWLAANPTGWVLNIPRAGSGVVLRHRSACPMIRGARDWTGGSYYKVVAQFRESLDRWLSTNWPGPVRPCGHCERADKGAAVAPAKKPVPVRPQLRPGPSAQISPAPAAWQLWSMGRPVKVLDAIQPQLASWDHREHPNQKRLSAYLTPVHNDLAPLLVEGREWAISLIVDVGHDRRLHRHHDVENYLTPLVKKLGPQHFVYAAATKRVGGGSQISIGPALRRAGVPAWTSWSGRVNRTIASPEGKRVIRESLCAVVDAPLPPGPVAVHLAWRLSATRNWADLWKPTGDAMGPVLGEPKFPHREFAPDDDRITDLTLHRIIDDDVDGVDVGMWWGPPSTD